ncbi:MAG: hypothetical protein JF612_04395 [Planctomycetia bacterium]|nr:hypothetical protein [Planctomycetia bacterium]
MENDSPSLQEGLSGLLKMAGLTLIALAIPLGAGVAVREIKRHSGGLAIVLCFSIVLGMSALGFVLILASGKIMKRYERTRSRNEITRPEMK